MVVVMAMLDGEAEVELALAVAVAARATAPLTLAVVAQPTPCGRGLPGSTAVARLRRVADAVVVVPATPAPWLPSAIPGGPDSGRETEITMGRTVEALTRQVTMPGSINLRLTDLRELFRGGMEARAGVGRSAGDPGEAAGQALRSSSLADLPLASADACLVTVTGGADLPLSALSAVGSRVEVVAGRETQVVCGDVRNPRLANVIQVTIVAAAR